MAGALNCPVRPSTDSLPNDYVVVEGYKYPPTTTTQGIQVSQTSHSIQELVQSIQDTIQKNQSLSKSKIHSKLLVTKERVFARVL
jgi:molybdopterin-guanine dinucleotide biosynthesis protein